MKVIKVKTWGKGQGDFVEINEADFDPKFHKKFSKKELDAIEKSKKEIPEEG